MIMSLQVLRAPDGWVVPAAIALGDPTRGYTDPNDRLKATVNAHILVMCMAIGWGEITERNARDWHRRARAYEVACDASMRTVGGDGKRKPYPLTLAMVRERIGLQVNVTKITDTAFRARLTSALFSRVDDETRLGGWADDLASAEADKAPDGWGSVTA